MPTINANQFFDPQDSPFEVVGFYEEYIELETEKREYLGCRVLRCTEAPRSMGSDGKSEQTLIAPIVLRKGLKERTIKASPERPVRVCTMVQALCGRARSNSCNKHSPQTQ